MAQELLERPELNLDIETQAIVEQIEAMVTLTEIEQIALEPVMKATGYQDQGYRRD
ncbi:MAG TPA: hypothetical protein VJJ78_02900 [Candidatus Saccharimonadales bacterium]|nr:hypothetical protein [Candidatus Saccharimonadales bacterium]